MSRAMAAVDRAAALAAGTSLVALGAATMAWYRGYLNAGQPLEIGAAAELMDGRWWSWISAAVGIVLLVVGLWWLVGHWSAMGRSRVGRVTLMAPQGQPDPLSTADITSVARVAADALEQYPSVTRVKAVTRLERNTPTVSLMATVPARHGIRHAIDAVDSTAHTLSVMVGNHVAVRTVLRVNGKDQRTVVR